MTISAKSRFMLPLWNVCSMDRESYAVEGCCRVEESECLVTTCRGGMPSYYGLNGWFKMAVVVGLNGWWNGWNALWL